MTIKINIKKHFIQKDQIKVKVRYSYSAQDEHIRGEGITIYEKDYSRNLLKIFEGATNNSDSREDSFEDSRVFISKNHPFFKEVLKYVK